MEEWIKSENKWIRRLAIATIPPYIRAKPEESMICLEFLERVMYEEDKDVKKAIGWALREVSKKDPESVFKFLLIGVLILNYSLSNLILLILFILLTPINFVSHKRACEKCKMRFICKASMAKVG